jgi:DNA repair protein RadC
MKNISDKLFARGAEALTGAELVAMLIWDGTLGDNAAVRASELLSAAKGSLAGVVDADISRLRMAAGMGKLRAQRLKAAAELGRRLSLAEAVRHDVVTSDADVVRIMEPMLGGIPHEECWVLYLESSGRVLERMRVSQGGVQATVVDCKILIKRALELLAVQIVLVHNHPSGSVEPSRQDIDLTERVEAAARLFDIRLLDHVIVARGAHYSFRGHGVIK